MGSKYEYGVGADYPTSLKIVRNDLKKYSPLGGAVSREVVGALQGAVKEMRDDYNISKQPR